MSEEFWIWLGVALLSIGILLYYARGFRKREELDRVRRDQAVAAGIDVAMSQHPHIDELACIGCGACVDACPEGDVLGIVSGRAVLINGLRCVGHGRCEEVCPVGALKVGLGDVSGRTDLPILDEANQTNVPGIYIAGELSGFSLIRNAIEQGKRVGAHVAAHRDRASRKEDYDLVVVGAGPAGISTALTARQLGLRCLVLDQQGIGGTVLQYPRRKLVLTQPVELPLYGQMTAHEYTKEDLLEIWSAIPKKFDLEVKEGFRVADVHGEPGRFEVGGPSGVHTGANVVLAMGRRGTPRRLGVPGEDLSKVSYQLLDAQSYTGRKVLIVGGGDSAVEAAMALAKQSGNEVSISYRRDSFARIKKRNQDRLDPMLASGQIRPIYSSQVSSIENEVVRLTTADGDVELSNDDVFVMVGGEPPFPFLKKIGIRFHAEEAQQRRAATG